MIRPTLTAAALKVADCVPAFERMFTTADLVAYGAATWDWHRLHYDSGYARSVGLAGVILDGQALGAVCARPLIDWLGPRAFIRKLSLKYRSMVSAGELVLGDGQVTAIRPEGEHDIVKVALRLRIGDRVVAEAGAEVRLPRQ